MRTGNGETLVWLDASPFCTYTSLLYGINQDALLNAMNRVSLDHKRREYTTCGQNDTTLAGEFVAAVDVGLNVGPR